MATTAMRIPQTGSSVDRTSAYATAVVSGEIVAGPHVRNACRRHLDDLKRTDGIWFDEEAADEAFAYFENVLHLSEGQFDGQPFKLHESQAFIVGSIFGWKREDGRRRFRRAYIEQGKGNGKSPLAGGIGLKGLASDGEAGAQIYAAAAKRDQAGILFADAVKMVKQSPALAKRLEFSGGPGREFNIAHHGSGSFFRPVSRDTGKTGSGPRPYFVLADEVHELPDRKIIEMLERGFKFRRQPLLFMITNSGSDRNSVAWEEHEHAVKVAAGNIDAVTDPTYLGEVLDDTSFAYVCALDEERTETFSYCAAMRYMEKSCTCHSVPTTLIDQLQVTAFANHVISNGIAKRAESVAPNTPIDPSLSQGIAPSVIPKHLSRGLPKLRLDAANTKSGGSTRIEISSASTSEIGWRTSRDIDWRKLKSRLSEITESQEPSSTNSSTSKTGAAQSAESAQNGSVSTIVTVAGNIEDCFASPAIQDLVFSEILQSTWNAHSPTCEARKSELQGRHLRVKLPADDPLNDPSCWIKANPLLGVTITEEYLAETVAQAKAIPGQLNGILRLHFCVWTDAETAWMTRATLEPALADFDVAEHKGEQIWLGMDLSQNRDITAIGAVVRTGTDADGKPLFDAWVEAWTPGDTLAAREMRDKLPYAAWSQAGFIHAPAGESVSYLHVAQTLVEYDRDFDVQMVAYDRFAFRRFEEDAEEVGLVLPFVEHPQGGLKKGKAIDGMAEGLWMPGSLRLLEDALLERRIRLKRNPVLISAMMSAVIEEDKWGNHWLAKTRSVNKIDAAVALAMAMGAAMANDTTVSTDAWLASLAA
jgi:phage terminase large subunit-like protein